MRYVTMLMVWAFVGSSIVASKQATPPPKGEGRITGRILTDSGGPIEGAVVNALLFTDVPAAAARYHATTGADGGYVIDGLPPGRFRVFAEKQGYSNLLVQPGRIDGGAMVDLETVLSGIDLVLRRTASVAGWVKRPDGTPVQGARVFSQIRLSNGTLVGTGPPAVTGADGRYRLEDVPPGTYAIAASYSAMHDMRGKPIPAEYQEWARTFHPATTDFGRATPITMNGGEQFDGIDIVLQPETRYGVSGVVVAEDGSLLRNVRVEYGSAEGNSGVQTAVHDGRFTFRGLSGEVTLLAVGDTDHGPVIGIDQLNVTASLEHVRLVLGPPAQVRGRVVFEGGSPPPDSPVEVEFATVWHRMQASADRVRVGSDGRFSVDNLIGERRVIVTRRMPQWRVKEVRRGRTVLSDGCRTLSAGQVVDDLEIVLARAQ